jgi:competence protein ComEC
VAPWLAARLELLGPLAMPVAITLGAQVGVSLPALLIFGGVPLVSVPANVLAVPVAGAVMLYGLPAGLLAGLVPGLAPVVLLPCRLGVRWIDIVAALGARLEPGRTGSLVGWTVLAAAVGALVARRPRQR